MNFGSKYVIKWVDAQPKNRFLKREVFLYS